MSALIQHLSRNTDVRAFNQRSTDTFFYMVTLASFICNITAIQVLLENENSSYIKLMFLVS